MFIAATPGIGKTRLAEMVQGRARAQSRKRHPERAWALLSSASTVAEDLGLVTLREQIEGLQQETGPSDPAVEAGGEPEPAMIRHEGDLWTVAFEGRVIRLRDPSGLHYLARLLRQPNQEPRG